MGIIGSFATGFSDPKDVAEELLSPPMKKFLYSLSDKTKEYLNIPLKPGISQKDHIEKDSKINDPELGDSCEKNGKVRKSSAPV